jgi:hypothetical protein
MKEEGEEEEKKKESIKRTKIERHHERNIAKERIIT